MRLHHDIEQTIDTYTDTVWRVCSLYFRQNHDIQDAFQETFLKYSLSETLFKEEEHRKAWLIRVATNICKDMLKAAHRSNLPLVHTDFESPAPRRSAGDIPGSGLRDVLEAFSELPDPPRTPLYLALYEGYSAPEISEIVDAPINTVYSWIARGKQQLKEALS